MKSPLIAFLLVLPLIGCANPHGRTSRVQAAYDTNTGELKELTYDDNGNGRVDTWVHLQGTRILRAEADHDEDGRIDRWEHYDADGSPGQLSRIEIATRRDGRVNRIEFFHDDVLDRVHEDTNGDGRIDKWETYRNSALAAVAFDMQGRGTPDRRLLYRADGSLERIETDADGDGTFQAITTPSN
jgi:hypothetical protein